MYKIYMGELQNSEKWSQRIKYTKSYSMFMDRKTQNSQEVSSSQFDLQIQCKPNQNSSNSLCGYWENDSKVYMERKKIQISLHNIVGQEHNWKTDTTQPQDSL